MCGSRPNSTFKIYSAFLPMGEKRHINMPIFGTKRISKKNWAMEIQGLGPNSPFRAPWDPEGARYQVKVCVDHESNSGRPMGGSWDQIWPTGALRGPWGPPKGHLGAKTSPFKAPGVQKGPDTRSKCTWTMNLTQAG